MNKIFGIGLHKTGTSSLARALNILDIKCSHWEHYEELYKGIQNNDYSFEFLKKYQAVVDLPVPCIFANLDRAYPNSKFILTIRDTENWFKSVKNHFIVTKEMFDRSDKLKLLKEEELFYKIKHVDKNIFIERYENHNKEVIDYFKNRKNDLLVIDIIQGDGWDKICRFLDKRVPNDVFPIINKRKY